jgi:hypothetical protein
VLDADGLATVRIGPARDVPHREEAGHARFEIGVYDHSAVEVKAGLLGKFGPGAHADASNHEVRSERAATFERDSRAVMRDTP